MDKIELGLTKLKTLLHRPKAPAFPQFLNLWSLQEGALVGVNLDFSTVFELEPESVFLLDPARVELFGAQTRSLLNALPPYCTLQFLVQIRQGDPETIHQHRKRDQSEDALSRLILDQQCGFLASKFLQRRRYYLFVTSHPTERKTPATFLWPTFPKPFREITREFHALRLREHRTLEQAVSQNLHGLGLKPRKLPPEEMLGLIFRHLNPKHPHAPTLESLSPRRTLREQMVFSPLKEEFDHLLVNDSYFRALSLARLPELSHLGYTQRLLNSLWPDCDLCLTIHALDTEKALAGLKLKNNITRTLAFSAWNKNYEAEQKHLELDELLTEIRASAQRLFRFSLSVLLRADSLEALREKTIPVLGAFHDFASAEAIADDMNHFRVYATSIPGHGELNDSHFYIQTNALAGLLPLTGAWRGSFEKKILLETPLGELIGLDPFDPELPAKHGLILGTTGSGKSFTTNYLLSHFLAEAARNHVVVIDVGGSYRKMARSFEGEYLEVSLSEEFGFNPFPARSLIAPNGEFDGDAVAYLSLLLSRMCLRAGDTVSVLERVFLEKAIKAAYRGQEQVILSDIRRELLNLAAEHAGAKAYAAALELWTSGMYGKLFNRPGQLDISNRLVVFDLQNLENHPDLQGVYFFVIRSLIWGKLANRALKKIIAIDEGWKFFNDEVGAELIENLYRTARKFNGAVFSISQSPKDFLDTKAANAIIANSYVKIILKLSKGHELLAQFDLNPNEVEAVRQLQSKARVFSDTFIKFGNRSVVARIEPCPLDYWICTTDAQDRVQEDHVRAQNPAISEPELLLKLAALRVADLQNSRALFAEAQ